jgi:hypothetical protein
MKVRRRFLLALMASLLLHLGVVVGPGWYLPSLDDLFGRKPAPRFDAWLVRATDPAMPKAQPKRTAKPRPAQPESRPGTTVDPHAPVPEPSPDTTPVTEAPPDEAPTVTEGAEPAVPVIFTHVRIRYAVTMGKGGMEIGQAIQEFRNDGSAYLLVSMTETTGLARLFKRVNLLHTSEGTIVSGRLQPREFRIEREGKGSEWARFDWEQGEVMLSEREQVFALEPGTQDMLSMFCELALTPIDGSSVFLPVVTGKKVERYEFTVVGIEKLDTPMGPQQTMHLRNQREGSESTDVWLGIDYGRLPVRIRHVDRKGEVFDQIAGSIEIDTSTESPH